MNNSLLSPVLAVVIGTSLGMALSVVGQKMINAQAIDNCWRTPHRHWYIFTCSRVMHGTA